MFNDFQVTGIKTNLREINSDYVILSGGVIGTCDLLLRENVRLEGEGNSILKDFDFGNPGLLKRPLKLIVSYSSSTNATITTTYYKDGDGSDDSLDATTWTAASNGGVKSIDLKGIGNVASLKFKFSGASVSGGCKINDITIVYRKKQIMT